MNSRSRKGAWIEILDKGWVYRTRAESLPQGSVD